MPYYNFAACMYRMIGIISGIKQHRYYLQNCVASFCVMGGQLLSLSPEKHFWSIAIPSKLVRYLPKIRQSVDEVALLQQSAIGPEQRKYDLL